MSFYKSGKLGTFHCTRPISTWRLLLPITFLLIPTTIALSRTADYHHHWQDVLAGTMLGFSIIWMVYRQVQTSHLHSARPRLTDKILPNIVLKYITMQFKNFGNKLPSS